MQKKVAVSLLSDGVGSREEADAVPMIPEADFYRDALGSAATAARPFQQWLTDVVLPTIEAEGVFLYGEDADQTMTTKSAIQYGDPYLEENAIALSYLFARVLPIIRATGAYVGHLPDDEGHLPMCSIDVIAAIRSKTERHVDLWAGW